MSADNRVLTLKVQPTGTEKNKASELLEIITQVVIKQQSYSLDILSNIKNKLEDASRYVDSLASYLLVHV